MKEEFSFASGANADYVDSLYKKFREDPEQVDLSWRKFFVGYEFGQGVEGPENGDSKSGQIQALINAYRTHGYLSADIDPLSSKPERAKNLDPETYGFKADSQEKFTPVRFGSGEMTVQEIVSQVSETYCSSIGAEYYYLDDMNVIYWMQERMESMRNRPQLSREDRIHVLRGLAEAEGFERFLQTKYLGQKRFSLEGLDSLVPVFEFMVEHASAGGVEEICIGMAHRGRLNVLANIMDKPKNLILQEFEGTKANPFDIDGDVKYHMGYSNQRSVRAGGNVRLFLAPNPSHLEVISPVVVGFTRSRQELFGGPSKVMPVLLHGDAAFMGQGVVPETLNMSRLKSYQTGGTLHIITNNQVGFTTNPSDSRSCRYASDIAKIMQAPILHVNADDPEACVWAAELAVAYRQKFGGDFVIDLIGYRRHGHNETDEPAFTQPVMYAGIKKHPTTFTIYKKHIVDTGVMTADEVKKQEDEVKAHLQEAFDQVRSGQPIKAPPAPAAFEQVYRYNRASKEDMAAVIDTTIPESKLEMLLDSMTSIPDDFNPHPKIKKLYEQRRGMTKDGGRFDWATGELLAFASLASEGFRIRLSGQDCKRGTFSSRHGVIFDFESGREHCPMEFEPGRVEIINSPLSEMGVLGFEFGFSIADPQSLVLWEAQFGDFANGAQIVIDQFLAASEAKWQQTTNLVLLLPHGYEGMGPEHSSARPERFLQICGNMNMQVCNVTTPAQLFHLLRRQMLRSFRKPLVLMTPKSLLRHPEVVSGVKEFTEDQFHELMIDTESGDHSTLIACTGKIYYDLVALKRERGLDYPILRIEQLYPFPYDDVTKIIGKFPNLTEIKWVQEEPQNMGGWGYIRSRFEEIRPDGVNVTYIGRKRSGSTAEGSGKAHQLEQQRIVEEAMSLVCGWTPGMR